MPTEDLPPCAARADQVTSDWLTRVLRADGALARGAVRAVAMEVEERRWSQIARVAVSYSEDAPSQAPTRLIVKICAGDRSVFSDSELRYYAQDYAGCDGVPLLHCYHAGRDEASGAYSLVLPDLSATHAGDGPPCLELGLALAAGAARLHACYWGAEGLARGGFELPAQADFDRYFAHVSRGFAPLREVLGGGLPPPWARPLARIERHHRALLLERARHARGLTLVHGDLNPGNLLTPRKWPGPIYFIDRQPFEWSLTRWLGVSDLAYAMVLFWSPEERRRLEQRVLREYQSSLTELGIEYAWEELCRDYRIGVLQCVAQAVEWLVEPADREAMRWLWELQLERSLTAYLELDCDALWPPK